MTVTQITHFWCGFSSGTGKKHQIKVPLLFVSVVIKVFKNWMLRWSNALYKTLNTRCSLWFQSKMAEVTFIYWVFISFLSKCYAPSIGLPNWPCCTLLRPDLNVSVGIWTISATVASSRDVFLLIDIPHHRPQKPAHLNHYAFVSFSFSPNIRSRVSLTVNVLFIVPRRWKLSK